MKRVSVGLEAGLLKEREKAFSRQMAGRALAARCSAGGAHGSRGYDRNQARRDTRRLVMDA